MRFKEVTDDRTLEPAARMLLTRALALQCSAVSKIATAWEISADRARILRGRPLPGSLRPEQPQRKPKRAAGPAWQAPEPAAPGSQPAPEPAAPSDASPADSQAGQEPGAPGPGA